MSRFACIALSICLVLTGCTFSVKDTAGIRRCLEDAGRAESYAVAIKERYQPNDPQYNQFSSTYLVASTTTNGYLEGLSGDIRIRGVVDVPVEDYEASRAFTELTQLDAQGRELMGAGVDPASVVTTGAIVKFAVEVVNEIQAWHDRRKAKAIAGVIETLQQSKMRTFASLNQQALATRYASPAPGTPATAPASAQP
ncbi:MAG TPA: hypothetical protein VGN72_04665 [Tepidisphaeraceae bacterium]|jgi:hypothetical protein|nr:hypothetical protein [Tepidisphaeraceae bacterium]